MSRDGTLPPGVEAHMIPGNRPEDEEWDKIEQDFLNQLTHIDWLRIENLLDIIGRAIAYGINIGLIQQQRIDEENRFYEEQERYHPNR